MNQHVTRILALLIALLCCVHAHADFTGRVVGVSDGDTLVVLRGRDEIKIRLAEIDAPESGQPYGARAKQALADMVYGRTVRVAEHGADKHGRILGRVYVGRLDVNAEMVRMGLAWVFDRYATDKGLYVLQDAARRYGLGLWRDPAPMPPWEWRHRS